MVLLLLPIDSTFGRGIAGMEWTDPMALNRSALPGLPARKLWRSLPTSGVLRTCDLLRPCDAEVLVAAPHTQL